MAVLAECPRCHTKQSTRNKQCKCGAGLDKLKRNKKIKYWVSYRMPDGKQRRESLATIENVNPYSIEDAKAIMAKRKVQKKERRVLDMLPESDMTFQELADWYLGLPKVKNLKSFDRVDLALDNFNSVFGSWQVNDIKQIDLEGYQDKRSETDKRAPATIDMEIKYAQTAVTKAFDNDKTDGRALKAFRKTARLLKKGSNERDTTISIEQYIKLIQESSSHLKATLAIAFNTGMRLGEIRELKWKYIDRKNMMIRLPQEVTKEGKSKNIPINHSVKNALNALPRAINGFVITYRGNAITHRNGLKKAFKNACVKAEIPYGRKTKGGITFHDIRRTVKTNMLAAGVDKTYRDIILGHALQGMDAHYIKPTEETLKEEMEKYTTWLDGQLKSASVDQTVDQKAK